MWLVFTGHDSRGWEEIMSTSGGRGVSISEVYHVSWVNGRDTMRTLEDTMIHIEDIMIHTGDITSTLGNGSCSAHWRAHWQKTLTLHVETSDGLNIPWSTDDSPTPELWYPPRWVMVCPHMNHDILPMYWTSCNALTISLHVLNTLMYSWYPKYTHDIPLMYQARPMCSWCPSPDMNHEIHQCTHG